MKKNRSFQRLRGLTMQLPKKKSESCTAKAPGSITKPLWPKSQIQRPKIEVKNTEPINTSTFGHASHSINEFVHLRGFLSGVI